jgi:hypothetical protein
LARIQAGTGVGAESAGQESQSATNKANLSLLSALKCERAEASVMAGGESKDTGPILYFLIGVVLTLVIWGQQLIGVTVNVWLGGSVLLIAFVMMVYAFWIWEKASRWHVKLRAGTVTIAAIIYLGLIAWQIRAEWKRERSARELEKQPAHEQESQAPKAASAELEAASSPKLEAKHTTSEPGRARVSTPSRSLTKGVPAQSCPNGICIGGDNSGSAIVNNNYGPDPPHLKWNLMDEPPYQAVNPQVWVHISIDRDFLNPKFAVICDRPCKTVLVRFNAGNTGGFAGGFVGARNASIPGGPNIAAAVVDGPNPMPMGTGVDVCVESGDKEPPKIVAVKTLTIKPST